MLTRFCSEFRSIGTNFGGFPKQDTDVASLRDPTPILRELNSQQRVKIKAHRVLVREILGTCNLLLQGLSLVSIRLRKINCNRA